MWTHHHGHHRHARHCGPRGFGGRGGFGGRFGFGEEGGRSRRLFDGGELRLVLLKLIADEPRHGYDLIRAIEERTGGAYAPSPGVVYPTITMLQDMGHIEEQASEGAKRSFAATEAGRAYLEQKADEVAALFARLDAIGAAARRTEGSPVRRAMQNLRLVLQQSLGAAELSQERFHAIAEIIDEAARKIERL
jgi:DNA-binding PadR family transcriptional regulator